jgi:uncharacterized membrane protein
LLRPTYSTQEDRLMSQIVSIAFDDAQQADQMLGLLKELQQEGLLSLEDAASVVRDANGKVSYRTSRELPGAGTGALMGGLWGLLFGSILFVPLLGAAGGAALGAIGGALSKNDLDETFRQQINDQLRPNTSMLFLRVRANARGEEILRRLGAEQLGGKVLKSNLSEESERALQQALSSGSLRS